jgi:hypothetical protein
MVYFRNFGVLWNGKGWNILWPLEDIMAIWYMCVLYGNLVCFMTIWYILPRFCGSTAIDRLTIDRQTIDRQTIDRLP